jgi:hypothetical protein
MARNRRKMSLYEVMGKGGIKSSYGKTLKKQPPEEPDIEEPTTAQTAIPDSGRAAHWPRKPKIVQFNAGRVEISMPYPLAIAVLLGIVLLFLVALWLGETGYLSRERTTGSAGTGLTNWRDIVGGGIRERKDANEIVSPDTGESKGDHQIVIQTYKRRADLEMVQYHFAEGGIETEIRQRGDTFYLVTTEKYDNPDREGTDGYAAKQKIIEWGVTYKAPQGYEPFGAKSFETAYGDKFDD